MAPFGSVWLHLAPFESLTPDSGFNFSQSGSSINFSELIRMLCSLRLGLLNLPRMVKILELRTWRQIMEASATGSIGSVWLCLAPFGSGGFWISDLYGGFYSSFFGFTPVSHPCRGKYRLRSRPRRMKSRSAPKSNPRVPTEPTVCFEVGPSSRGSGTIAGL